MINFNEEMKYKFIRESQPGAVSFEYFYNRIIVDDKKKTLTIDVCDAFEEADGDTYQDVLNYRAKPDSEKTYALCNQSYDIQIGAGILDFINSGVAATFTAALKILGKFDAEYKEIKPAEKIILSPETEIQHIKKQKALFIKARSILGDVLDSSLYTAIFPPKFYNLHSKIFEIYLKYVAELWTEYLHIVKFCFDAEFYAEDLHELSAAKRFSLYSNLHFFDAEIEFKQRFSVAGESDVEIITPEDAPQCAFEKDFDCPGGLLEEISKISLNTHATSLCTSLREMLAFELFQMLRQDIKIKRCKNCGKYFILKGNYKTDYCTNIPIGETQTCQAIAAAQNYKSKVDESTALQLYNRFYKKYHARVKVGTLKTKAFKNWQYAAVVMRDRCLDENDKEIDLAAFETWLEGNEA